MNKNNNLAALAGFSFIIDMARKMSFMLTTQQMKDRTKTKTRRLGWWNLKDSEIIDAVEKGQGLKRGEKMKHIGQIQVLEHHREPLDAITQADVVAEGFPELTPQQFIEMFCSANKCAANEIVNVITFTHL